MSYTRAIPERFGCRLRRDPGADGTSCGCSSPIRACAPSYPGWEGLSRSVVSYIRMEAARKPDARSSQSRRQSRTGRCVRCRVGGHADVRLRGIGVWLPHRRDDPHPGSELAPDRCTAVAAADAGRSAPRPARARGLAHAATDADTRACGDARLPSLGGQVARLAHTRARSGLVSDSPKRKHPRRPKRAPGALRPLRRARSPCALGRRHPFPAPARDRLRTLAAAGRSRSTRSAREPRLLPARLPDRVVRERPARPRAGLHAQGASCRCADRPAIRSRSTRSCSWPS